MQNAKCKMQNAKLAIRNPQSAIRNSSRGQATVELGVALMILVVLFLGLVDVGYLLNHTITLENAAREGMRTGIKGLSDAHIVAAMEHATEGLDPARLRWTIAPADGEAEREPGAMLSVELWYEDHPPLPLRGLFENPYTLHVCRKGRIGRI